MRFDWRRLQPRLCSHEHMWWRRPEMQFCQAKIGVIALLRFKNLAKTDTSHLQCLGVLKSNLYKIFGITGQVPFFHNICAPALQEGVFCPFFFKFPPPKVCPTCPTFARCPTAGVPGVCPTSARRRLTSARRLPVLLNFQKACTRIFFKISAPTGKWSFLVNDVKISISNSPKNGKMQKQGLAWNLALSDKIGPLKHPPGWGV